MTLFFDELPEAEREEVVRKYWTTWLAAMGWGAKNEAALADFIKECETFVGEWMGEGGGCHDGIGDEEDLAEEDDDA